MISVIVTLCVEIYLFNQLHITEYTFRILVRILLPLSKYLMSIHFLHRCSWSYIKQLLVSVCLLDFYVKRLVCVYFCRCTLIFTRSSNREFKRSLILIIRIVDHLFIGNFFFLLQTLVSNELFLSKFFKQVKIVPF
jgi:hypothetical protein